MIRLFPPRPLKRSSEPSIDDRTTSRSNLPLRQSEELRKPNLFVIGAMKSGTTYLSKLLGVHPSIFICSPEEPSYFVDPEQLRTIWPAAWDLGYWRSEEHYLRLFRNAGNAVYLGEASTNYSKCPLVTGVVERLYSFNPDARIIYLLRDPVERSISHYWHMARHYAEQRPLLDALKADPQYIDVSNYAMQLRPYLERFGTSQVHVLTFEDLIREPEKTMAVLYNWLGVDPAATEVTKFAVPENVTPEIIRISAGPSTLMRLRQSRLLRGAGPYFPHAVRLAWREWATKPMRRSDVDTTEARDFLRIVLEPQTAALVRITKREFPEWNKSVLDT